jgi:hypothetical protein
MPAHTVSVPAPIFAESQEAQRAHQILRDLRNLMVTATPPRCSALLSEFEAAALAVEDWQILHAVSSGYETRMFTQDEATLIVDVCRECRIETDCDVDGFWMVVEDYEEAREENEQRPTPDWVNLLISRLMKLPTEETRAVVHAARRALAFSREYPLPIALDLVGLLAR